MSDKPDMISRDAVIAAINGTICFSPHEYGSDHGKLWMDGASTGMQSAIDAIRALPAAQVSVKPLEWGHHPMGWIAAPPTGQAYIIDVRVKGRVMFIKGMNPPPKFDDLEAAKAAAQADYEARIRSALTIPPAPDPDQIRADAMREALALVRSYLDAWDDIAINGSSVAIIYDAIEALIDTPPADDMDGAHFRGDEYRHYDAPPAVSDDVAAREIAYQSYINEMTPNGNSRIDNFTICAGPNETHQRHIATQVDMAFQAGWHAALAKLKGGA